MKQENSQNSLPKPLFVLSVIYGGMAILAGVLGFKQVALHLPLLPPLAVEAGIFPFLTLVVLSSTVAQLYGRPNANRLVLLGFIPLFLSIALIALVLALPPSPDMPAENLAAFERVLGQTPRIMTAGPIAYGTSMLFNIYLFDRMRGADNANGAGGIMVRGAIASAISQALDTVIFVTLAFYGEFPIGSLLAGQMLAKVVLSFLIVPFLISGLVALVRKIGG